MIYRLYGKRILDVGIAVVALVAFLPFAVLLVVVLKVFQGGGVFFRQPRVGRQGKTFEIYKFRTMEPVRVAYQASLFGRPARVTPIGKWMRSVKLDEWPQFWNVLIGDMSVVGPRPETRNWVDTTESSWNEVLSVKPGLTDFASLKYRNEEQILATVSDPQSYYKTTILPDKLRLGVMYVETYSLSVDLSLCARTVLELIARTPNESQPDRI